MPGQPQPAESLQERPLHVPCPRRSILARGLHALLPPLEVCKESFCNADPDNPRQWEPLLRAKLAGRQPTRVVRRAPFVQVRQALP